MENSNSVDYGRVRCCLLSDIPYSLPLLTFMVLPYEIALRHLFVSLICLMFCSCPVM